MYKMFGSFLAVYFFYEGLVGGETCCFQTINEAFIMWC